jgi:hypothetical protein
MEAERGKVFRRAIFKASCGGATVVVPAGAALSALLLDSGMLGILSLLGYAVAVIANLARPERWHQAAREIRYQTPRLPSGSEFSETGTRDFCDRLHRARADRKAAVAKLAPGSRVLADDVLQNAIALEQKALRLLPVLDSVGRERLADAIPPVRGELARLERAAARSEDNTRAEYERAVELARERLRALQAMERCYLMLTARLDAVACALETLGPSLACFEVQQATACVLEGEPGAETLTSELRALRETSLPAGAILARCPE